MRSTGLRWNKYLTATAAVLFALTGQHANAALLWGNNAGFGTDIIEAFDASTGAEVHQFSGISGNGRGVVVVGSTLYYTVTGDGFIHEMDATTGALLPGTIDTHQSSLSTISFDGTNFWLADYSGTPNAYEVSQSGVLLSTITLANATGFTDGLEYFNGKLIANRSDGCCTSPTHYDVYDLSGNLLTSDFIVVNTESTGIAFDGTNFFTNNLDLNSVSVWNGTTGAFINTINLDTSLGGHLIEDLSVDFASRSDTCGGIGQPPCDNTVPEPASMAMLGTALVGFGLMRRRRKGA